MLICIVPNPSIDKTATVDRLEPGTIHRPDSVVAVPGGKGLNVARAAVTLGVPVRAVLLLGGDAGRWMTAELDRRGIARDVTWVDGETRTCLSVLDRATGALTEFYEPGPAISTDAWRRFVAMVADVVGAAPRGSVAAISGSFPRGAPEDAADGLLRADRGEWYAAARRHLGSLPEGAAGGPPGPREDQRRRGGPRARGPGDGRGRGRRRGAARSSTGVPNAPSSPAVPMVRSPPMRRAPGSSNRWPAAGRTRSAAAMRSSPGSPPGCWPGRRSTAACAWRRGPRPPTPRSPGRASSRPRKRRGWRPPSASGRIRSSIRGLGRGRPRRGPPSPTVRRRPRAGRWSVQDDPAARPEIPSHPDVPSGPLGRP